MTDDELVALGLCDAEHLGTSRPAFIRMLLERGATVEDVRAAAAGGQHYLSALASEFVFFPPGELTVEEVAALADVSVDKVVDMFRALGLTDPRLAGSRLTERDVELIQYLGLCGAMVGEELMLDMARTYGTAVAQMAEAGVNALRQGFEAPQRGKPGSELAIQRGYESFPSTVVAGMTRSIETVYLRGVVTSLYSEIVVNDGSAVQSDRTIVFVDLVDFTGMARRTETNVLSKVLAGFEIACVDEAVRHNGRVVKMLGDGAMLAFNHRDDALAAACELVHHHPAMPPCRAGVATGRVFTRTADYFGPIVNLASRLAGVIEAGEIAVDDSEPVANGVRMAPLLLKGFDEPVTPYRVSPID